MNCGIHRRLTVSLAFGVLLLASSLSAGAATAAPAPAWHLFAHTNSAFEAGEPSAEEPRPAYLVKAINVGEETIEGTYSIVVRLAAGLTPELTAEINPSRGLTCQQSVSATVTMRCTGSDPIPSGK